MSAVGCWEILTHWLFLISHIKGPFEDTAGERRKERVKLVTLPRSLDRAASYDGGLLGGTEAHRPSTGADHSHGTT